MAAFNSGATANYPSLLNQLGAKNIMVNGDFRVNQHAYVSNAVLASGSYGHDGWKGGASGGDYTFTQLANSTVITIKASKTLIQVLEAANVVGGTYVLSWTGTALARYAINSATPAGAYAASPIVISGQTAGTTMSVEFGNGASTGTLSEVQLEVGTVAPSNFERRIIQLEMIICERYFQLAAGVGLAASTVAVDVNVVFRTEMRATPTVQTPAASVTIYDASVGPFTQSSPSASWTAGQSARGGVLRLPNFTGLTAARGYSQYHTTPVPFSAEL